RHRHLAKAAGLLAISVSGPTLVTGGDNVYCRQQGGIVSPRFRQRLLASLAQNDGAAGRITVEKNSLQAAGVFLTLSSSFGYFARALDRDAAKNRGMHQLIDQPELQRLLGADVLAGEDQVERVGEPDAARQSLRAARARDKPQLHFGKSENRFGMI